MFYALDSASVLSTRCDAIGVDQLQPIQIFLQLFVRFIWFLDWTHLWRIWHSSDFFLCFIYQGAAADVIKKAMLDVDKWLSDEKLEARMVMQVHDELVLEVENSCLPEVQENVVRIMSSAADLHVPLVVDVGVGDDWNHAHWKWLCDIANWQVIIELKYQWTTWWSHFRICVEACVVESRTRGSYHYPRGICSCTTGPHSRLVFLQTTDTATDHCKPVSTTLHDNGCRLHQRNMWIPEHGTCLREHSILRSWCSIQCFCRDILGMLW